LAATLAAQVEKQAGVPVLEIYGSTETGALAMRRTALESCWNPLPGVRIESGKNGAMAWGAHFESPQCLNDQIEQKEAHHFSLLGRKTDLIKIAGRRASLAGLNLLLQDVPGLSDAVFYLPETDNQRGRLVLIYAGKDMDPGSIKSYLRGRIDSVFMPRTFIKMERLPRNGEGKLPLRVLEEIYQNWAIERV
jgi:acyl-coenzyme A synthetase/AMP-(fatty) acid ligase